MVSKWEMELTVHGRGLVVDWRCDVRKSFLKERWEDGRVRCVSKGISGYACTRKTQGSAISRRTPQARHNWNKKGTKGLE